MSLKKKPILKKIKEPKIDDSGSDEIIDESKRITSLRNFVSTIGLDWTKLNRKQMEKIARTRQYKQWAGLRKLKKMEDETLKESDRPFSIHRVHKPHVRPKETSSLDTGQVRKSLPGRAPVTSYKQLATSVINKGGTVTRSAGSITYKGRKGKFAYKATKHAQLGLGGRRLTLQPHKGMYVHGKTAQKLSKFPTFTKKRSVSITKPVDIHNEDLNVVSEDSIKAKIAHTNLINNGFIIAREGPHRTYKHKDKKIQVSLSRTGELSAKQTHDYRKAMRMASLLETEDSEAPIKLSPKTEKVLKKGKELIKKSDSDDDSKSSEDDSNKKDQLKFQYKKTLTGASDKGKTSETDIIELNPTQDSEDKFSRK